LNDPIWGAMKREPGQITNI